MVGLLGRWVGERVWMSACVVGCVLTGASPVAGARATTPLVDVPVRLINQHPELEPALGIAQVVAEGLYRRAGIRLLWVDSHADEGAPPLIVVIASAAASPAARGSNPDTLGMALAGDGSARGRLARVFGDRVLAFAGAQGLHAASLLGCVIAHELGHLLLPLNAHSERGIMQPVWQARGLPPYAPGVPGFLPWQADLLRQRASPPGSPSAARTATGPADVAN